MNQEEFQLNVAQSRLDCLGLAFLMLPSLAGHCLMTTRSSVPKSLDVLFPLSAERSGLADEWARMGERG
jgi:hypothetical protein